MTGQSWLIDRPAAKAMARVGPLEERWTSEEEAPFPRPLATTRHHDLINVEVRESFVPKVGSRDPLPTLKTQSTQGDQAVSFFRLGTHPFPRLVIDKPGGEKIVGVETFNA